MSTNARQWLSHCMAVVLDFDPFRSELPDFIIGCQGRGDNDTYNVTTYTVGDGTLTKLIANNHA